MKMRSLFLTLFCTICFSVVAQEDAFQQDIVKYLSINGTSNQYDNAYDQMLNMLQQQFASANVPQQEWDSLKENKSEAVGEVLTLLASAYRKQFSEGDIREMLNFYETDAAQQMIFAEEELSQAQQIQINAFYTSEIGGKIKKTRGDLAADISQISEYWSRDLFTSAMNDLAVKGYQPQH